MNRHAESMGLVSLLVLILAAGCGNEMPAEPELDPAFALADLWPHADGNTWIYELTLATHELDDPRVYPNLADVPPCPTLDELHADLQRSPSGRATDKAERVLRLQFDGEVTVGPGLVTQHLVSSLDGGDAGDSQPFPLRGGPWQLDENGIVEYAYHDGDLDTTWVHLTADLTPGTTFSCHVCYLISCNCCEHISVWRRIDQDVGDLGLTRCLEVLYLFEWGVSVATDDDGNVIGFYRRYVYGTVTFAEHVGPIRCRQRMVLAGSSQLNDTMVIDSEASLIRHDVLTR